MNGKFSFVSLAACMTAVSMLAAVTPVKVAPAVTKPMKVLVVPATHGDPWSGSITSVDEKAKTFVAKDAAGKAVTITWTEATKVTGGSLKSGEAVSLRTMAKNGRTIATTIQIRSTLRVAAKPSVSPVKK